MRPVKILSLIFVIIVLLSGFVWVAFMQPKGLATQMIGGITLSTTSGIQTKSEAQFIGAAAYVNGGYVGGWFDLIDEPIVLRRLIIPDSS